MKKIATKLSKEHQWVNDIFMTYEVFPAYVLVKSKFHDISRKREKLLFRNAPTQWNSFEEDISIAAGLS